MGHYPCCIVRVIVEDVERRLMLRVTIPHAGNESDQVNVGADVDLRDVSISDDTKITFLELVHSYPLGFFQP